MDNLTSVLEPHLSDVEEAVRLEEKESPNDPEDKPFKSLYAARELYNKVIDALPDDASSEVRAVKAALTVRVGINLCDTEERPEGEARLLHGLALCREGIEEEGGEKLYISILLQALNTLGRLFSDRSDNEQALLWLSEAERQYKIRAERNESDSSMPISFNALMGLNGAKPDDSFEKKRYEGIYTRTLYFMAQVHCKLSGHAAIAASYCTRTLARQLAEDEYEPLDWTLNAGALSQFFLTKHKFSMARYCLASAEAMFTEKLLKQENIDTSNDSARDNEANGEKDGETQNVVDETQSEKVLQGRADLHRCWAKYGLYLLDPTTEMEEIEDGEIDESILSFDKLNSISEHESVVACTRPSSMETARPIFIFVQSRLESAKEFYTLDSHCSDHVAVVQDHSRAFRFLADYFEPELDRQCRMHKRRLDMINKLIECLNPQHFLLICRQLLFECGEIMQSMVTAKTSLMTTKMPRKEMVHAMKKINTICQDGIAYYDRFLKSYLTPDGTMPDTFADEETRPILLSYFHIGHLYSKILESEKGKRINNIENSIRAYREVVDYCDRVTKARDLVPDELPLCEEMVQLLPGKIRKIALES